MPEQAEIRAFREEPAAFPVPFVENDGGGGNLRRECANSLGNSREVVEAAGVELKGSNFSNVLMAQDFWC
jgi:hypothetical protein